MKKDILIIHHPGSLNNEPICSIKLSLGLTPNRFSPGINRLTSPKRKRERDSKKREYTNEIIKRKDNMMTH
jgi:hypothetical protein